MNATIPPCAGMWDLFDSTHPSDHKQAKAICRTCPMVPACRSRLTEAIRLATALSSDGGPQGTWAGRLYLPRVPRVKKGAA